MKKIILTPLFAPVLVITYIAAFFLWNFDKTADELFTFTQTTTEYVTYALYALGGIIALIYARDFKKKDLLGPFFLFSFLFLCALLREMGMQHWLTQTDSTAFKIRFFTNPNNPLIEKLMAGYILLVVALTVIYLLVRFTPTLIRSFFKLNPIAWTVATLGGITIIGKIADRLPGNYRKMMQVSLDPSIHAYIVLFEEVSESLLPVLFAVAIIQYHFSQKQQTLK